MKKIHIYIFTFLGLIACSKTDTKVKTSGTTVISSEILGNNGAYYVVGFSFAKAANVNFNITSSTVPDIVVENNIDNHGTVIGANLSSPKNDAAFNLAGTFNNSTDAEVYFSGLKDFSNTVFSAKVDSIVANQVYLFKSLSNTYTKFWIQDLTVKQNGASQYAEITVKWVYQPDGSMTFPE